MLNVLVTCPVTNPQVAEIIRAVDPRVRVTLEPYTEPMSRRLVRRAGRGAELPGLPLTPALRAALQDAEVLLAADLPNNTPALAPRLKWVQRWGAGPDHFGPGGGTGIWESGIALTTTGGFNPRAVAEFVMHLILSDAKRARLFAQAQQERRWDRQFCDTLWDKTAGIIGLGRVGSAVARKCKAFDMRVLACRRSASSAPPPDVDELYGADGLHRLLAQSDYVVLAVPVTPDTEKIIGWAEFQQMKRSALFINVARGLSVDDAALTRALAAGVIAAAALDVFTEEPLPKESPLWALPHVSITPHAAAALADYDVRATREFADNLRRYIRGEPLADLVDRAKGY